MLLYILIEISYEESDLEARQLMKRAKAIHEGHAELGCGLRRRCERTKCEKL